MILRVNAHWDIVTPLFRQSSLSVGRLTYRMSRELRVPRAYEHIQTTGPYWMLTLSDNSSEWANIIRDGNILTAPGMLSSFLPPFSIVRWYMKSGVHRVDYVVSYEKLPRSLEGIGPLGFTHEDPLPANPREVEELVLQVREKAVALSPTEHVPETIARAKAYIDAHYAENFRMRILAKSLGISHEWLTRTFQRTLGISPVQYRVRLRCFSALYQIQTSELPVALCAADSGYNNIALFNRQFREVLQAPPSHFRF